MNRTLFFILACLTAAGCNNGSLLDTMDCFTEEGDFFKAHEGHAHDDEDDEDGEPSTSEDEEEPTEPGPCDP